MQVYSTTVPLEAEHCQAFTQMFQYLEKLILLGKVGTVNRNITYIGHFLRVVDLTFTNAPIHARGEDGCPNLLYADIPGAQLIADFDSIPKFCNFYREWHHQYYGWEARET